MLQEDFSVADRVYLFASALLASSPAIRVSRALKIALRFIEVVRELENYRYEAQIHIDR